MIEPITFHERECALAALALLLEMTPRDKELRQMYREYQERDRDRKFRKMKLCAAAAVFCLVMGAIVLAINSGAFDHVFCLDRRVLEGAACP